MINSIKTFFVNISKLPTMIKDQLVETIGNFRNLRYRLNNLSESNMELGVFHLRNRNWNDAEFRFKLVIRFLDPGNKLAHYWLGWVCLLKQDHKQAIIHFEQAAEEDKIGMLSFVKSIDTVHKVPNDIYALNRDIMTDVFMDKFASETEDIPQDLVHELNEAITDSLPEEYNILELGSNIGLLGKEINKRMQESYKLVGVEPSAEMIKAQDIYFSEEAIYDSMIQAPIDEFLDKSAEQYDVILSLDGFSFESGLKNIFQTVFSKLSTNGYFAFAVHSAPTNGFSNKTLEFHYNNQQIREELIENGFNLLVAKDFTIEIKNNYSIFVCKK